MASSPPSPLSPLRDSDEADVYMTEVEESPPQQQPTTNHLHSHQPQGTKPKDKIKVVTVIMKDKKLGHAAAEVLHRAAKRVWKKEKDVFIRADLSGNKMFDKSLGALISTIRKYPVIKSLDMRNNNFTSGGLAPFLDALTGEYVMEELKLGGGDMLERVAGRIVRGNTLLRLGLTGSVDKVSLRHRNLKRCPPFSASLTHLSLSHNLLPCVPDSIVEIKNLKVLLLGNNKIKEITPRIGELKYLMVLSLKHNKIRTLPNALITKHLKTLNLAYNRLSSLPNQLFATKERVLTVGNPFHASRRVIFDRRTPPSPFPSFPAPFSSSSSPSPVPPPSTSTNSSSSSYPVLDPFSGSSETFTEDSSFANRLERVSFIDWEVFSPEFEEEERGGGGGGGRVGEGEVELGGWVFGDVLGQGISGTVFKGRNAASGEMAAIKVLDLSIMQKNMPNTPFETLSQAIHNELAIHSLVHTHPNIVGLGGYFEENQRVFLCMELVEGLDLIDYVNVHGRGVGLGEGIAKRIFYQLCSAVSYCHEQKVIHGDLKPDNIIVQHSSTGVNIKLIDFGFALRVAEEPLHVIGFTYLYSPPYDKEISYAWDAWSVGVILYAMCCNRLPFSVSDFQQNKDIVLEIPSHISEEVVVILGSLLEFNCYARGSVGEVFRNAKWLEEERRRRGLGR